MYEGNSVCNVIDFEELNDSRVYDNSDYSHENDDDDLIYSIANQKNMNENLISIVIKLVRYLRSNKYSIPLTATIMFLEAVESFDILSKKEFFHISKSLFCKSRMEYEAYSDLFGKFFLEKEVLALKLLAQKEKEELEQKLQEEKNEIENEIEKLNQELISKNKKAMEEVLNSRFKVYKEHKETLEKNKEDYLETFEEIRDKYISEQKDNDSLKMTSAFMELKKDIIKSLCGEKRKINFNKIKNSLEDIMLQNMRSKNNEELNELLLKTASTVEKVESEFNNKVKALEEDVSSKKLQKQNDYEKRKRATETQIEEGKVKVTTSNHRTQFNGKGAVIELLKNTDRTISKLDSEEYQSLLYYIKINAPKFRTKVSSSMKKAKNKRFDFKKTLQKSVRYNGIPLEFFYKKPIVKKYKLYCVLDVSGSVSRYLKLLSSFLFELSTVFNGGIEVYGFVSDLIDFTSTFRNGTLEEAASVTRGHRGYSDYNTALQDFYNNCFDKIDKDTVILYFGDARNNKNDTGEDIIRTINSRCRFSVFLNPEEKEKWNTGDSIIDIYSRNVNVTYEINKVNQMIFFLNDFAIK